MPRVLPGVCVSLKSSSIRDYCYCFVSEETEARRVSVMQQRPDCDAVDEQSGNPSPFSSVQRMPVFPLIDLHPTLGTVPTETDAFLHLSIG